MPSKTLTYTRAHNGSTATDGWLNYPFSESWTVPDGYKITTVSCSVTQIRSAGSESFPRYSSVNGNAIIYISFNTLLKFYPQNYIFLEIRKYSDNFLA